MIRVIATKKAYSPFVKCDRWEDFFQFSKKARIVVYNFGTEEDALHIYAIKERIFAYKEPFPFPQKTEITRNGSNWKFKRYPTINEKQPNISDFVIFSRQPLQKKFECGILYSVIPKLARERGKWTIEFKCELNPETVAEFLSETLKVPRDRIVEGDVYGF